MSTENQWYIKTQSGKSGPFKFQELQYFADRGKIKPNTAISNGGGEWIKGKRVDGLYFPSEPPDDAEQERPVMPASAVENLGEQSSPFGISPRDSELSGILDQPPSEDSSGNILAEDSSSAAVTQRPNDLDQISAAARPSGLVERETELAAREARIAARESELATRENAIADREATLAGRESTVRDREAKADSLEMEVRSRESDVACREADVGLREEEAARRESEIRRREAKFLSRETESAKRNEPQSVNDAQRSSK